jgi:hypothetical protein
VVVDVREQLALGPNGTSLRGPREPGEIGRGRTWVYEEYGVRQAQEWLGHSDPATTLRHYVRLTTAARAKAVAGLDEVTRAALDAAQAQRAEEDGAAPSNVVALAGRRGRTR